jgi:uncharacterized membrane protein YoaK (UPF0700 family)
VSDEPSGASGFFRSLVEDPKHGPLPALLLILTTTTGVVDAVSIISLGRVFVANMTGNVVFIGFALVGVRGFSLAASLSALGGFLVGALGVGLALERLRFDRATLLRNALVVEFSLVAVALILAVVSGSPIRSAFADPIAAGLAIALGLQNTVARRLAVPDLPTTVLTMTLTGIAADVRHSGGAAVGRRLASVTSMFAGGGGGSAAGAPRGPVRRRRPGARFDRPGASGRHRGGAFDSRLAGVGRPALRCRARSRSTRSGAPPPARTRAGRAGWSSPSAR